MHAALLVVDMQYLDAHRDFGMGRDALQQGRESELEYYFARVDAIIPRIGQLQEAFRASGMPVIHTRLRSVESLGRDMSLLHRRKGWSYPAGSVESEFLPQLAPADAEIVIDKTSSSPFNSTSIDTVLRNLDVEDLYVTGVDTRYCIESTVRDAADRGYLVVLIDDACATMSAEMQQAGVAVLADQYAVVRNTDQVLRDLRGPTAVRP